MNHARRGAIAGSGSIAAGGGGGGTGTVFGFDLSFNKYVGAESVLSAPQTRLERSFSIGGAGLPIAKVFRSGTPTTWDPAQEGVVSGRRVIACYGPQTTVPAAAAGNDNARLSAWASSVPRDWRVIFCFFQEADDNIQAGDFSAGDYKAVFAQHYPIIKAAQKAPSSGLRGNQLELWPIFSTPFNLSLSAATAASWLPSPSVCDGYGWDVYLNPNGQQLPGHTGDIRYDTAYDQDWATRCDRIMTVHQLNGMNRWLIGEAGAPARDWDTDGTQRDLYLTNGIEYCLDPPLAGLPAADAFCFYNSKGTNWDQRVETESAILNWDHSGGPNANLEATPSLPVPAAMKPDEPFVATYSSYINAGPTSAYIGPS